MSININGIPIGGMGMKTRRRKFGVGYLLLFLFISVVFISVGFFVHKSQQINPSWPRTNGSITSYRSTMNNGQISYTPVVGYTVKGQSYTVSSSTSSSSMPVVGATVPVAYNPSNPSQAKVISGAAAKVVPFISIGIGILMLILGPVMFIRSWRRSKDINNLRQTGRKITGVLVDIRVTGNNGGNRVRPGYVGGINNMQPIYKVIVAANDPVTGSARQFTSDPIMGMATVIYEAIHGQPVPIDIYINPSNPNDYYVDISELPSLTPQAITDMLARATGRGSFAPGSPVVQSTPATPAMVNPVLGTTVTPTPAPSVNPVQNLIIPPQPGTPQTQSVSQPEPINPNLNVPGSQPPSA